MGLGAWLRKYRETDQLKKELEEWRRRALRAEEFWGERQKEIMDLSLALQNEKAKTGRMEDAVTGQMIGLAQNVSRRFMAKYGISIQYAFRKDERGKLHIYESVVAMNPLALINVFAEMLHTDKETLLAKLGQSPDTLQEAKDNHIPPAIFSDNYSDIGGKLYPNSHCGRCQGRCAKRRGGGAK